jgi:hypothetical protein
MLLQNRIDFGRISTSVRIEAPVVLKPDTDSKIASVGDGMVPESIYGRLPARLIKIQERVTVRYASFCCKIASFPFTFVNTKKSNPTANVIIEEIIKGDTASLK